MSQPSSGSSPAGTKIVSQQVAPSVAGVSSLPASSHVAGTSLTPSAAGVPPQNVSTIDVTTNQPIVIAPSVAGVPTSSTAAGTTYAIATTVANVQHNQQNFAENNLSSSAQLNLEGLQSQINILQAQLLNAQRALSIATNANSTPSSSAAMPQPSNMAPPVTGTSEVNVDNSASANVDCTERRTPFYSVSCNENNFSNLCGSQPLPPNFRLSQNGGSLLMHRKIYDLPDFSGSPEDWPMFSTAFNQSTAVYNYNNFENCLRLQKALKGDARECVKSLLIHADNVSMVIEQLCFQYGRPEMLIRCQLQQVKEISPISESAVDKLVPFAVKVRNLAAFLETANGQQHLANPTLMEELVGKLPMSKRMEWARCASTIKPYPTILDFSKWLKDVADLVRMVQTTSGNRQNNEPKRKVVLHAADGQRKQQECPMCQANHKIFDCRKFGSLSMPNRWSEVKKMRLCFSCLGCGHSSRFCRYRKTCPVDGCLRKHNKLLHDVKIIDGGKNELSSESPAPSGSTNENESVLSCVSKAADKGVLLFRVVPIVLYGPSNKIETYALLDEGSSVTMVDSSLVKKLGLQGHQSQLNLNWYAVKASQETATVVDMHVSGIGKQRKYALRNVYGVSNLKLPAQSFNMDLSRHPGLPIKLYNDVVPKVLIGLDHCHLGLPDEIVSLDENGPYAANTPLGWVVFGKMMGKQSSENLCLLSVQPEQRLYDLVANYFETENFGVKLLPVIESKDDLRARKILNETTVKIDGRFQTRLLWRADDVVLPDSYSMALNRLVGIERKMKRSPEFGAAYKSIMRDYLSKSYIRKLSPIEVADLCPRTWYLPHFGVVNPNKPGKIRLVFDAAATVEGVSLNSKLLKGPQQYKPLPSVLFNFRVGAVAVCGDIKEMFHQVIVAPEDRCSQRFLWREDTREPPDSYEMLVMTFVKSIVDHHYVDDFVDSFPTSARAIEIAKQVRDIHKSAGFELRNFSSNSSKVIVALKGTVESPVNFSSDVNQLQSEKILGMYWQPKDDTFRFNLKFHNVNADVIEGMRCPTKRELLSVVMSVFDPLGFLSYYMITAKLLMREVWRHNIRWDDALPGELNEMWNNWRQELQNVINVKVPRFYFRNGFPSRLELHVFVDASEDAFGAVSYWRSINADNKIEVTFVAAKTRCAPLKAMSIPRLELQAAVLGTRLMGTILKEHSIKVSKIVCWSDSTTVVSWIGSESRRYKPFVAHRITEILDSTSPADWRWLPTNLNVADETTRMKSQVNFSDDCRWFTGPKFLYEYEDEWPKTQEIPTCSLDTEELRPKFALLVNTPVVFEFDRFSSYLKLKRTIAWVLRFINRCQKKIDPEEENGLTTAELKSADICLCRQAQREHFSPEIEMIKNEGTLPKNSELYALSPYMDENSLLRVYGRVDAASWLPLDIRRPIILPSFHPVTELFVAHVHEKMKHQNFEATVCEIRRSFWIPRLRKILRKRVSNCFICRFRRTLPVPPLMGSLPKDRLTPYIRPFSYTGLDYFGPLIVTIGRRHEKRWVALFTCLTIRAIHLEVAFDLSTDACILAIRNFINRRGLPTRLRSDNGTNFVGADKVAKRFREVFDVAQIQDELTSKGIDWQFNCPHNPAEGGIWERMVQCVKRVLQSTLKESAPREHTLQSFLIEAENIMNSRPLTHLPLSHEDEEPLTPNNFLLGCPNTTQTPAGAKDEQPVVLKKQWRISRQLRDHFWNRWIKEYLPTLTRRSKWCQRTKPIAIGDLVLICDPAVSRRDWKRGRVEEVFKGRYGVIRRADVRTSTGILKRPVSKLAVLDLE
ncbi:uncharacterized protein LOC135955572 [Calliphora vicina]|uniref:uncharacterized protein LOC135955572 n=1 Tax=Calliphora vicina TaxID=7373 RepID=UPI00325B12B8